MIKIIVNFTFHLILLNMLSEEALIEKMKRLVEARTGWGDSKDWVNQDFVELSDKILDQTRESLSHVTLKRIWGKVRYDSLPNTHTLDTIAKFVGYSNWRDFKSKNQNGSGFSQPAAAADLQSETKNGTAKPLKKSWLAIALSSAIVLSGLIIFLFYQLGHKKKTGINPADFSFTSKKAVSGGVPNSVIFDFDATKAPIDSVIIQQEWDTLLRYKVPKDQHHQTAIYYFPGYFQAKLVVGNQVVKEHDLLITSDGWLTLVEHQPTPIYFPKGDAMSNGRLSLSVEKIKAQNITLGPNPPRVLYSNVRDFGEIYSDDFEFEASLKNDYKEGSAICQQTNIYLQCEGPAIAIPLCAKGCVSDIDLLFTDYYVSGKKENLSAFGVGFDDFVKVRIRSLKGKADIFINDKLAYQVTSQIIRSKIVALFFRFQGTGSVDYVTLSNGKVNYRDDF
jgi:hypothetical protein